MLYQQPKVSIVFQTLNTIDNICYMLMDTNGVAFKNKYEFVKRMRISDVPSSAHNWLQGSLFNVVSAIEDTLDQDFRDYLAERARIRSNPEEAESMGIGAPAVYEVPIDENSLEDLIERFQYHLGLVQFHFDESGNKHLLLVYGKQAAAEQVWSDWTKICRGIIIDLKDMKVIVHPYDKFRNLNECAETREENLPDGPYEDAVKEDGSMVNFYVDTKGRKRLITKGSYLIEENNVNGKLATRLLYERYPQAADFMAQHFNDYTFMFEVVYNKNHSEKIIVSYEDDGLILIGVRDLHTNMCMSYTQVQEMARKMGVPAVRVETMTIEKMLEERKNRKNFEGWVRAYFNGLRVKVKCEEYLLVHWAKFYSSHRKIWLYMFEGTWDDMYANFNDEQKEAVSRGYDDIRGAIQEYDNNIRTIYRSLPNFGPYNMGDKENNKTFSAYVKEHIDREFQQYMYQIRNGQFTSCVDTIVKWVKFRDLVLVPYIGSENIVETDEAGV